MHLRVWNFTKMSRQQRGEEMNYLHLVISTKQELMHFHNTIMYFFQETEPERSVCLTDHPGCTGEVL